MFSSPPRDKSHHRGVVSKVNDVVAVVSGGEAVGVEQGPQHTALSRAGVEVWGCGCVCSHSHPLTANTQEALDPHAGKVRETQVHQFVHQSVGGGQC